MRAPGWFVRSLPDSMDVEYDDLWVVSLVPGRAGRLLKLNYGPPSPAVKRP